MPVELFHILVRSWRWACLVTWFCYRLIAKTDTPLWPDWYDAQITSRSLYGLYGPWCLLSPKRLISLISLSISSQAALLMVLSICLSLWHTIFTMFLSLRKVISIPKVRSGVKSQGHWIWTFPDHNFSLNSVGYRMMHQGWNGIEVVLYCFSR